MEKKGISVTEAARNFSECVNRVRYQNVTYVLLKNGRPVARLAPEGDKRCTGADLAAALAKVTLSEGDAKAWHRDLQKARRHLKPPSNKWQ